MPEQLAEVAGRFVWGHPNTDDGGRLIRQSNCQRRPSSDAQPIESKTYTVIASIGQGKR